MYGGLPERGGVFALPDRVVVGDGERCTDVSLVLREAKIPPSMSEGLRRHIFRWAFVNT